MMIGSPDKPGDALKLKAEIARRGRLRFIINTEPHGDHRTGNAFFDVPVIAREGGRTRILDTDTAQHLARVASFGPEKPKLLEGLGTLDEEVFAPGHGAVCDKSYLDEQGEYVSMPCPGACQFSAARLG